MQHARIDDFTNSRLKCRCRGRGLRKQQMMPDGLGHRGLDRGQVAHIGHERTQHAARRPSAEGARLLGAYEDIVLRGRKPGIGQRASPCARPTTPAYLVRDQIFLKPAQFGSDSGTVIAPTVAKLPVGVKDSVCAAPPFTLIVACARWTSRRSRRSSRCRCRPSGP